MLWPSCKGVRSANGFSGRFRRHSQPELHSSNIAGMTAYVFLGPEQRLPFGQACPRFYASGHHDRSLRASGHFTGHSRDTLTSPRGAPVRFPPPDVHFHVDCSGGTNGRTPVSLSVSGTLSQTLDVFSKGLAAFRVEVFGMRIHPGNRALAIFDRQFGFAACLADHGFAHKPIVCLGVADSQFFAGCVSFIEAAFTDETDNTVGKPVKVSLDEAVPV